MEGKAVMLLLVTLVCASFFGASSAKSVTVGGSTGWTIPNPSSFYTSWASKQSFQVGDVLVFNFPVGAHTVAEVSKANYDSCNVANTVGPVLTTGPANITLKSATTHYFVCTVTGHCSAGQKLAVTVGGSKATAPVASPKTSPTPSAAPSPMTTPSAAPSPMTTPSAAPSPMTTPSAAPSPMTTPTPASSPASSPSGSGSPPTMASSPSADGPAGAAGTTSPPPSGNSAAVSGASFLSLVSIVAAALVF